MFGSRNKGAKAERDVAAFLTTWWSAIEPETKFVKTPLSGGWSTPTMRAGFHASGDIMTTSPTFPFAVEVKRREAFSWDTFLKGRKSPVWGWWEQTCRAAAEQDGVPMLWLRHNQEPWRVVLPCDASPQYALNHLVARRFVLAHVRAPADVFVIAANAVLAIPPGCFLPAAHVR